MLSRAEPLLAVNRINLSDSCSQLTKLERMSVGSTMAFAGPTFRFHLSPLTRPLNSPTLLRPATIPFPAQSQARHQTPANHRNNESSKESSKAIVRISNTELLAH
jgi:hypothetical protein